MGVSYFICAAFRSAALIRRGAIVVDVTPKETTGTLSCSQLATLRRREGRERERREREERERRERIL